MFIYTHRPQFILCRDLATRSSILHCTTPTVSSDALHVSTIKHQKILKQLSLKKRHSTCKKMLAKSTPALGSITNISKLPTACEEKNCMISSSQIEHNPPLTRIQSIPSTSKKCKNPKISQVTENSSSQTTSPSISPGPMLWSTQPNILKAPPATMKSPTHPTSPSFTSVPMQLCSLSSITQPPPASVSLNTQPNSTSISAQRQTSCQSPVTENTPAQTINTSSPPVSLTHFKTYSSLFCQYCSKEYSHKSSLSRHMSTVHSKEKGSVCCELCDHR